MKHSQFIIGEDYVCTCGNDYCKPFKIVDISDALLEGIDIDGKQAIYNFDDFHMIRKLTKLEKAMK